MRLRSLLVALALLSSACGGMAKSRRADPSPTVTAAPAETSASRESDEESGGMKDLPVGVAEASADCKGKSHKGTLDVPRISSKESPRSTASSTTASSPPQASSST